MQRRTTVAAEMRDTIDDGIRMVFMIQALLRFTVVMSAVASAMICQNSRNWNEVIDYGIIGPVEDLLTMDKDKVKGDSTWAAKLKKRLQSMIKIKKGFTIDSGAADHVMPMGWLTWLIVVASAGSRRGLHYVAASGTRIPNLGQQAVRFLTESGTWTNWTFQVAAINKPLVSVSKLVDDGWKVVFDEEQSFIKHKKTGRMIDIKRER